MNFITSAKAFTLAAATIATALISNIAPSSASQPGRIISTPGQPEVVIYDMDLQSFAIGCPQLRTLWSGIKTEQVSPQEYQTIIRAAATHLVGQLHCNAPNLVKGYTSPTFPNAGVIVTGGTPFYVSSSAFFSAMGITPTKLNDAQGKEFLSRNLQVNINATLEPRFAAGATNATISLTNRGAYVARFNLTYDNGKGGSSTFDSGDVVVGKTVVFKVPSFVTRMNVAGKYYTGLFAQTKPLFSHNLVNPQTKACFTTTGTVFNPQVSPSCN